MADRFGAELSPELAALVLAAEEIRGLRFLSTPNVAVVSDDELARRVAALIAEDLDPEELAIDEELFELLGILDGSVDLAAAYQALLTEQVLGYYDGDTGELVVVADEGFSPLQKTIVVHELIHALVDQHFGFAAVSDALIEAESYHQASALQALVEGDATYFQILYMKTLPQAEQLQLVTESLSADTTVLDSLPDWMGDDLVFPYDQGFAFVERIIEEGGLAGLAQAYETVPTTTEQVLHPTAYFAREPGRPVDIPATAIEGYDVVETGEFGEWNIRLLLLGEVPRGEATIAAAGWGGDGYRLFSNGTEIAMVLHTQGDSPQDGVELAAALVASLGRSMAVGSPRVSGDDGSEQLTVMQGADYAAVTVLGADVVLVVASDPVVGQALTHPISSG